MTANPVAQYTRLLHRTLNNSQSAYTIHTSPSSYPQQQPISMHDTHVSFTGPSTTANQHTIRTSHIWLLHKTLDDSQSTYTIHNLFHRTLNNSQSAYTIHMSLSPDPLWQPISTHDTNVSMTANPHAWYTRLFHRNKQIRKANCCYCGNPLSRNRYPKRRGIPTGEFNLEIDQWYLQIPQTDAGIPLPILDITDVNVQPSPPL